MQFKKYRIMKKSLYAAILATVLFSSCANEFNRVYKTSDNTYKYEYAKESYANGKYVRASSLLQGLVTMQKGTDNAQESLYMLAMAEYNSKDYEGAAATFKKYFQSYPKGVYAEKAEFYIGMSLYNCTPEPRLDQSQTVNAIAAFQEYMDLYPDGEDRATAQQKLFELQDKLVEKEYLSSKLYYDLGSYSGNASYSSTGNNYLAAIVTAQNVLKEYPYTKMREELSILILRAKYHMAKESVLEKREDRMRETVDEYYAFKNEFPESKYMKEVEDIFKEVSKYISTDEE